MQYTTPDYYDEFSCLAEKCPNTCCAGWQIVIDEKSLAGYLDYQKAGHIFGNRLCNGIDWEEGVFYQDAVRRCEFLNEENLCDIYQEAGKDMLCHTCKTYPRHIEEYEELREISLCLSCPEAARIILSRQERVQFYRREDEQEEIYEDFDYLFFTQLMDEREHLLEILQDRSKSIDQRMHEVLQETILFQQCIDSGELYRFEELKERNSTKEQQTIQQIWTPFLTKLAVLDETWLPYLKNAMATLYEGSQAEYEKLVAAFGENYPEWEVAGEQLMVYWLFTYFGGAVYDGNALGKIKLAYISTLLVRELSIAKYKEAKGSFTQEDLIQICMRYSREVEHDEENLKSIEDHELVIDICH